MINANFDININNRGIFTGVTVVDRSFTRVTSVLDMRNGISNLGINQLDGCLKAFNKIIYALLALSLLPVLTAYFAYGTILGMLFFTVTLVFFIGLIYLVFAVSEMIARIVLFFGVGLFIKQLA